MSRFNLRLATATAIAIASAFAASAQAAAADDQLDAVVGQYCQLPLRSAWINPLMPQGTGLVGFGSVSGDEKLQAIVATYDRARLDRGGWRNAWADGDHYAAGEPLLAVQVGAGVTSGGGVPVAASVQLASR
jgi:hypothetical protein